MFVATSLPYRVLFFEMRQAVSGFAEVYNDCWRESGASVCELITRVKASAKGSCLPQPDYPGSIIKRFFGAIRERLTRVAVRI